MSVVTYPTYYLCHSAVNMLLAFVLLFAMVKINSINIRNAAKMELNNVSARIYADTFHSQREANLESYMKDLHLSHSYQEALRADFINSLKDRIDMENGMEGENALRFFPADLDSSGGLGHRKAPALDAAPDIQSG